MFDRSNWPFTLEELSQPAYLVGGWVRDRLLGRQFKQLLDLDFVLPTKAVETAREIATRHQAGFVLLDAERQIARVVFANATADFAQQVGNSLTADLQRRDFCMNAIALDCQVLLECDRTLQKIPQSAIVDPLDGQADLQNKLVRMVAPENLQDDPLRLLRAYRQAAQLGFTIEPLTRQVLKQIAERHLLKQVAAERIRTELAYLLSNTAGSDWLKTAIADGILIDWLSLSQIQITRFSNIDAAIATMQSIYPALADYFNKKITGDRPVTFSLKLAALVSAATTTIPLELSRHEQRWVLTLLRHLPQFKDCLQGDSPKPEVQYKIFQQTGDTFPAIATLALAEGEKLAKIQPWIQRWLEPSDPIAYPVNLITGDDLKLEFSLKSGRQIGELLEAVKLVQVAGTVNNRQEAIAYVKAKLENSNSDA